MFVKHKRSPCFAMAFGENISVHVRWTLGGLFISPLFFGIKYLERLNGLLAARQPGEVASTARNPVQCLNVQLLGFTRNCIKTPCK